MVARSEETNRSHEQVGDVDSRIPDSSLSVVAVAEPNGRARNRRSSNLIRFVDAGAGAFLAFAMVMTAMFFLPVNLWFEVRSVQVFDSTVGTSPRMLVDRTIHREFLGEWIVVVYKVTPTGYEPACRASGQVDYNPDARYPANMDLDWWTWPTQCNLPEGEFVTRTTWNIDVFGLITKMTRATSNPFHIYASEAERDGQNELQTGPGTSDVCELATCGSSDSVALAQFFP